MTDSRAPRDDETPQDAELEEPSTEKDPGEELEGGPATPTPDDVDHQAVGIGVVETDDPEAEQPDPEGSPT